MKQKKPLIYSLFCISLLYPAIVFCQTNSRLIVTISDKSNLEGIKNEEGKWVIAPKYKQIIHLFDDYYHVHTADNETLDEHQLYRLNLDKKQLELQPFCMVDDYKNNLEDRWIVVAKKQHNKLLKGLLDIKHHQLSLPLKYDSVKIAEPFIIVQLYDKNHKNRYSEVYNIKDLKKLFYGYGYIAMNEDNFLVQSSICSEKENNFYEYSTTDENNVMQYCYQIFNIYDTQGNKLSVTYSDSLLNDFKENWNE